MGLFKIKSPSDGIRKSISGMCRSLEENLAALSQRKDKFLNTANGFQDQAKIEELNTILENLQRVVRNAQECEGRAERNHERNHCLNLEKHIGEVLKDKEFEELAEQANIILSEMENGLNETTSTKEIEKKIEQLCQELVELASKENTLRKNNPLAQLNSHGHSSNVAEEGIKTVRGIIREINEQKYPEKISLYVSLVQNIQTNNDPVVKVIAEKLKITLTDDNANKNIASCIETIKSLKEDFRNKFLSAEKALEEISTKLTEEEKVQEMTAKMLEEEEIRKKAAQRIKDAQNVGEASGLPQLPLFENHQQPPPTSRTPSNTEELDEPTKQKLLNNNVKV